MKAELLSTWLSMLRSGEYKQGQSFKDNNGNTYCPLGLLALANGWEFEMFSATIKRPDGKVEKMLPDFHGKCNDGSKWPKAYGVNWPQFAIADTIINMNSENNGKRHRFPAIADYIEANVLPI